MADETTLQQLAERRTQARGEGISVVEVPRVRNADLRDRLGVCDGVYLVALAGSKGTRVPSPQNAFAIIGWAPTEEKAQDLALEIHEREPEFGDIVQVSVGEWATIPPRADPARTRLADDLMDIIFKGDRDARLHDQLELQARARQNQA